ncbi:MAG: hypothetical protein K2X49_13380 [Acetobacteraceae bacterium]|nr:hypothetical protein [Acetobacteraceae bacterium]
MFGQAAVTPRLFDRTQLVDGDVVTDFLRALGIEDLAPEPEGPRNPSLRADVQELIRRYNAHVEARGVQDRPRLGPLLRDERYWGRGRMPARAEAEGFLARFAAGNERIRATWFPERATLFGMDFPRYPEAEDTAATADARVLAAALDVLVDLGAAMQEAEAERRMALGRHAQAEGRMAEARSQFSRVLRAAEGHRGATKALRELDAAEGLTPGGQSTRVARKKDRTGRARKDRTGRKVGEGKARKADAEGGATMPQDARTERKARREARSAEAGRAERRAARKASRTAKDAPRPG